jgi:O-antigen/teichoic acid export membrane protein
MRAFTISVTAGAIVNFIFNLILIRPFQSVGTGIATVIAEITVTFVQLCFIWKDINVSMLCKSLLKYVVAGMLTCVVAQLIGIIMHSGAIMIAAQIIAGAVVYFLMLFVLRSQMNQKIFSMGLKIIRKVRNR